VGIRLKVALVVGVLAATTPVGSCSSSTRRVICDYAQDSGTFVGRLVGRHGSSVAYRVEAVQPSEGAAALPQPVRGTLVVVHYEAHEEQFLHAGERYSVRVWPINGFFSGVHTANRPCSGGTVHADGTAIDTALSHQSRARHILFSFAAALAVVGLFVAAWALRRRRRQRKNVEELLGSES
jgi:hypothetical protein